MTAAEPAAPQVPWVTRILLALNILVFLAMVASGVSVLDPSVLDLIDWGATLGPLTVGHQWWRLGSSMFLHIGLVHIALNMLCLASLGPPAEERFGRSSFLAGYLLAGLGGAITSVAVHPQTVAAGASGAIFGVASRLLVAGWVGERTGEEAEVLTGRLGSFLTMNLLYGFLHAEIDNSAHIGGLLTGAVLGVLAHPRIAAWVWRGQALVAVGLAAVAALLGRSRTLSASEYALLRRDVVIERMKQQGTWSRESALREQTQRLEQTIQRRPDSAAAYLLLAQTYAALGEMQTARDRLHQGIQSAPRELALHRALGDLSLAAGDVQTAIDGYEGAFKLDSMNGELRYSLADAWQRRGGAAIEAHDTGAAVESFRRVLSVAGDSGQVASARGQLQSLGPSGVRASAPSARRSAR
ncbi:MAG TPA: rhomboid family intramembrane serine protease [Gemmatimonadales bacterium]|nr:rhomboid family intramembrane serine protease [Gemmatimonadales bacterium]